MDRRAAPRRTPEVHLAAGEAGALGDADQAQTPTALPGCLDVEAMPVVGDDKIGVTIGPGEGYGNLPCGAMEDRVPDRFLGDAIQANRNVVRQAAAISGRIEGHRDMVA